MSEENRWDVSHSVLIAAIQKRPGIYDRYHPDNKKEEKDKLWIEICEEVVPNWDELQDSEKNSRVLLIQRKWKNLRDSFRREFNTRKKLEKLGYPKRKREYIYFKALKFLEPFLLKDIDSLQNSPPHDNLNNQENADKMFLQFGSEDSRMKKNKKTKRSELYEELQNNDSNSSNTQQQKRSKFDNSTETPHTQYWDGSNLESFSEIDNYSFHESIDEDRYFLLSLLPSLRGLSNRQKISVKLEFLQILQKIDISDP